MASTTKKSSKIILPPTGFMLTSSLLGREGGKYSKTIIQNGISRDYTFGNNVMRSVCEKSNGVPRSYGESEFLRSELDSVDAIREFAQRFQIPIKSLSVEAQRAINLGYVPKDTREFHMKELNFEEEDNPLILFSKRRRSSLESKIGKTLERIGRYRRDSEIGRRDENFEMLRSSLDRLEEELDYNLLSWRASRDTPFALCDTCTTDFAAVTYLVNTNQYDEEEGVEEITDRDEIKSRLDLVRSYASNGRNRITFNEKNNFVEDKRDRAVSFYTQNPKNNSTVESRIITPRDLIEATIGDRSHDGYKQIQLGKIEELRRGDPQFARLVRESLEFARCSSLRELYEK